jgi:hypothetical protein
VAILVVVSFEVFGVDIVSVVDVVCVGMDVSAVVVGAGVDVTVSSFVSLSVSFLALDGGRDDISVLPLPLASDGLRVLAGVSLRALASLACSRSFADLDFEEARESVPQDIG